MGLLWWVIAVAVAIVWVLTAVDIFRRHYSAGATVGWLVLIVVLPFVGSVIYWLVRKPTAAEAEQVYEAQADVRRSAGSRRF
jgi:hypothetical protein